MVKKKGGIKVRRFPAVPVWQLAGAAMLMLIIACGAAASTPGSTTPADLNAGADGAACGGAGNAGSAPAKPPTSTSTPPEGSTSTSPAPPSAVMVPVPSPTQADGESVPGVPMIDTSIHDVTLGDIVFDTFNGRFVPLDQASEDLILGLRDAIVPIAQPAYGGPDALPWLQDSGLVIGYA